MICPGCRGLQDVRVVPDCNTASHHALPCLLGLPVQVERHLSVACVTSGIIDQYVLHVWLRVDWSGVRGGVRILVQDWVHLFAGEVKVRCHGLRRVLWAQALISCERGVILILLQIMGLLMSRLYLGLIRH